MNRTIRPSPSREREREALPDYGQWQAHIPPDVSKNDETIETDAVESMDSDEIASNGTDVVEQSVDETMNQGVSNDMSHRFRKVEILQRKDYSKVYIVEGIFGDIKKRKYVLKTIEKFEPFVFHACVEFKILRSVAKKPFLMQMVYAYQTIDTLDIVLEYHGGGHLFNLLRQKGKFAESWARFYIAEIILALECLHGFGVIHRDIKAENVLIDDYGHIVVTDFDISAILPDGKTETKIDSAGTLEYQSPESLRCDECGTSVDWWATGILLCLLLTYTFPFDSISNDNPTERDDDQIRDKIKHSPPHLPSQLSKVAKDLISKLLKKDAKKRLGSRGANDIKSHKFFQHIDWEKILQKEIKVPIKPPGPVNCSNEAVHIPGFTYRQ